MMQVLTAAAAVLAMIYLVPFAFYAGASALKLLDIPPAPSPQAFLLGILVTKIGTALAFVLLVPVGAPILPGGWLAYGAIWFAMFAASEAGDAISGRSAWPEAIVGIAAEAVYAPASAAAAFAILGRM